MNDNALLEHLLGGRLSKDRCPFLCFFDGDPERGGQFLEMARTEMSVATKGSSHNLNTITIQNQDGVPWRLTHVAIMDDSGNLMATQSVGIVHLAPDAGLSFLPGELTIDLTFG